MEGLLYTELATEMVRRDTPLPTAMIILVVIIAGQLGVILKVFLPVWLAMFKHSKSSVTRENKPLRLEIPSDFKNFLDKDVEERAKRRAEVDNRFDRIEAHIEQTSKNIERLNVAVSGIVNTVDELSCSALENRLFTKAAPAIRRLRAFKKLIALKNNGPVKVVGVELAADNPDTWLYVLSEPLNMNIVDQEFFDGVVEEINIEIRRRAEDED